MRLMVLYCIMFVRAVVCLIYKKEKLLQRVFYI